MYREADRVHREYDACTREMSDIGLEFCDMCGQPLPKWSPKIDNNFKTLDSALVDNIVDINSKKTA